MKNMKKIKLGAISGGSLIPLIIVASCSSTTIPSKEDYKITVKEPGTVYELDIMETEKLHSLETLSQLFEGVNDQNIDNLEVIVEGPRERANEYYITLEGKEGYTIEGKKSLKSKIFNTAQSKLVPIEPETSVPTDIDFDDIKDGNLHDINFLRKFFPRIQENDIPNMDITILGDTAVPGSTHQIVLTAKRGYAFEVDLKRVSKMKSVEFKTNKVNLAITAKNPITEKILSTDIVDNKIDSYKTLSKLFTGQESEFKNVIARLEKPAFSAKNRIILETKEGYLINDQTSFQSEEFTLTNVLDIQPVDKVPSDIHFDEIKDGKFREIAVLQKLFAGIKSTDIANMDITMTNDNVAGDHTLTLTAKNNYIFMDKNGKESQKISIDFKSIIILKIVVKPNVLQPILSTDIDDDNLNSFRTLSKFFTGYEGDFLHVDAKRVEVSPGTYKIELTPKSGYIFDNGVTKLSTSDFSVVNVINAKPKKTIPNDIYFVDIKDGKYQNINILKRLFDDINEADKANMDIFIQNETTVGQHIITLLAKDNYTFLSDNGDPTSIISIAFESIHFELDIKAINPNKAITQKDIDELESTYPLDIFKLLFDGVNLDNYQNLTWRLILPENGRNTFTIKLDAKYGYLINGNPSLESKSFNVILGITNISNVSISESDINKIHERDTLSKIFSGIEKNEMDSIESVTLNPVTKGYTVTLKAKNGYLMTENGTNGIISNVFKVNLNIQANDPVVIFQEDIQGVQASSLETLQKVFSGINDGNYSKIKSAQLSPVPAPDLGYQITLEAEDRYLINGIETYQSSYFEISLKIAKHPKIENVFSSDIKPINLQSFNTLKKIFLIDEADVKHVSAELKTDWPNGQMSIVLRAKDGFIFFQNDDKKLESDPFDLTNVELAINAKNVPESIVSTDIIPSKLQSLDTLRKLFDGNDLNLQNVFNFKATLLTNKPNGKMSVLLEAKPGYSFAGTAPKIESEPFDLANIELSISKKPSASGQILSTEIANQDNISIDTLKKLFEGTDLEENNIGDKFTVHIEDGANNAKIIVLKATSGFSFAGGDNELKSEEFLVTTVLDISPVDVIPTDIKFIDLMNSGYEDIKILEKLFKNIKESDIPNITIEMTNKDKVGEHIITLTANSNYTFIDGNGGVISNISVTFTSIDVVLAISQKVDAITSIPFDSNENLEDITFLELYFNGLNAGNMNNFSIAFEG
ncbi:MAG: hypothetical protein ACRC1F_00060, partial [Metamycoplasmataceae bacterium]